VTVTAPHASLISLVCLGCDPTALSLSLGVNCRLPTLSAKSRKHPGWSEWAGRGLRSRTVSTVQYIYCYMYHSASNVLYAQSQPHTHLQSDPVLQTSSQPMASHQPYSQRAELHADQTGDSLPLITTTHVHSAEQPTPLPLSDQWQTASRKIQERGRP
jgi:hypothetical protein